MQARLELRGNDLFCAQLGEQGLNTRIALTDDALQKLKGWAKRYDVAVYSRQQDRLPTIGREIAAWLNEGSAWLENSLKWTGDVALEIAAQGTPDERERVLLDVPWELMAPGGIYLAADAQRLYRVERRLGVAGTPRLPAHRDLLLLFMAAEVEGESALSYEQEESAILKATRNLALNLMVEESGSPEFLEARLAAERPDALHLSCHGDIAKGEPLLALEAPGGGLAATSVGELSAKLGDEAQRPPLVFLSACRTAEHGAAVASFAQALVRGGVANALGWDGSVYDSDAMTFAEAFYKQLAAGRSVGHAAAQARRELLRGNQANPKQGRHWHLARVYLGSTGGGPLCAPAKPKRVFRKDVGFKEFLDKANNRVPVATAQAFVGRRRQAQRALRAFRDQDKAGVLIHGMGQLGKSSLAARIANRMPHHEAVVLFERYDAPAVFEALLRALPPRTKTEAERTWREAVAGDGRRLEDALLDLLEGPFRCEDAEARTRPILLIVDDLERILEQPKPGETATPVKSDYTAVLGAIIGAFDRAETTESRLLLTSRYTFALRDSQGRDLATRLAEVPLPPMDDVQRTKQMHAAAALAGEMAATKVAIEPERRGMLERRIKAAAGGNPGLQDILTKPLLAGEPNAAEQAIGAVEGYLATGAVPTEANAAMEFFRRVLLEAYRDMLTADETAALRAATLFFIPVPRTVLVTASAALGVASPASALDRLQGLGLVDRYVAGEDSAEAAVNPLARPLVAALSGNEQAKLATAIVRPLYDVWKDDNGDLPPDLRGLQAAQLALLGDAPSAILNPAALAGGRYLFRGALEPRAALNLVETAIAALDRQEAAPDLRLVRLGADCAERVVILDKIADILFARGQLDEALRIRQEEKLPVYERLGDVAARAVTLGQIADFLFARGQLDEALRIRQEEELPVYERLGDVRSRAVTLGRIADILFARGQLDEALRIRQEEELPVYERLGDVRERAVTLGKIADILFARGQLDEALRIRQEEQLPVYERLGDVRSRAVTLGKIADILFARGQLDEALRIHIEERLPIAQSLQDPGSIAHIRFSCAQIRLRRGGLEKGEAQMIADELGESFSIYQRLGRANGIGHSDLLLGQFLAMAGYQNESLSVLDAAGAAFETLQQADNVAEVRGLQQQIREGGGVTDGERSSSPP